MHLIHPLPLTFFFCILKSASIHYVLMHCSYQFISSMWQSQQLDVNLPMVNNDTCTKKMKSEELQSCLDHGSERNVGISMQIQHFLPSSRPFFHTSSLLTDSLDKKQSGFLDWTFLIDSCFGIIMAWVFQTPGQKSVAK